MSLLDFMARSSRRRVAEARSREGEAALRERARSTSPPILLRLDDSGFDIIAELKLRSPAGRSSFLPPGDRHAWVRTRTAAYAAAGAAALSVLTEPEAFDGSLADLSIATEVGLPVMRKDFLVDPYQVFEARAAGASGVLLITRLLADGRLQEMLEAAAEMRLFVLLEAFGRDDLVRARNAMKLFAEGTKTLMGVNARDLSTLDIDRDRFRRCAGWIPAGVPSVAESGTASCQHIREVASLGYAVALVGHALMRAADPRHELSRFLTAGRAVKGVQCPSK